MILEPGISLLGLREARFCFVLFCFVLFCFVLFCFKKLGRVRNFSQIGAGRKQDPKVSGMVGWALGHSEVRPLAP